MTERIKSHVLAYNKTKGYGEKIDDIINTITDCGELVWEGDKSSRRWWSDTFKVVKIDGMLIGFASAITTGDDSPYDKGWEFNADTICEVVEKQITVTVYEPA